MPSTSNLNELPTPALGGELPECSCPKAGDEVYPFYSSISNKTPQIVLERLRVGHRN